MKPFKPLNQFAFFANPCNPCGRFCWGGQGQGAPGPQGPQGPAGPQGPVGPQGLPEGTATGAGYAETFEWLDGNPEHKDRRGYFVTLDGERIRKATDQDDYVLGVVSGVPTMTGGTVGLIGVLTVLDDGSCRPNGYCRPNARGIATASERGYRVLKRVDAYKARIMLG